MCVWNTNHVKSDGEIATKLGTWTKFDFVKNMGCFVSSVVSGIWEGKATKIFHGNVYRVEPPSGGSWTTRIIDVMLENLMCCREILCCWNERIQENLIQLSCQTITLWFPRQEARWQCSHQIEFVMTETRHTWISINIRMFLIWGLWRRALFQSWLIDDRATDGDARRWGHRGVQRLMRELNYPSEFHRWAWQRNLDPEVSPDQHTRQDQKEASLLPLAQGRPHQEKRMPRKDKDFIRL